MDHNPSQIFLYVAFSVITAISAEAHWGYKNLIDEIPPTQWQKDFPTCNGSRQSPIAINKESIQEDITLGPISFLHFDQHPLNTTWSLVDNGHVVQINGTFSGNSAPSIQGGGLGASYVFEQFHFHWGSTDSRGSEHVLDGRRFPIEMHIVLRKSTETDDVATTEPTGMAVVSVLFDVTGRHEQAHNHMNALIQSIHQLIDPNVLLNVSLPKLTLANLLPPSPDYYRYLGSLTTPPCSEALVWNIMKQPLKITEEQLNIFRALHEKPKNAVDLLEDNFRPLQNLNGRIIKSYSSPKTGPNGFSQFPAMPAFMPPPPMGAGLFGPSSVGLFQAPKGLQAGAPTVWPKAGDRPPFSSSHPSHS